MDDYHGAHVDLVLDDCWGPESQTRDCSRSSMTSETGPAFDRFVRLAGAPHPLKARLSREV